MGNLDDQVAHPDDVKRDVDAEAALQLRMQGFSYARIGKALGVSKATAWRLVTDALREVAIGTREAAEELRTLELARLDDLWRRLYPALPSQKVGVAEARVLLRISMQRSVLLGLPIIRLQPAGGPEDDPGGVDLGRLSTGELRQFERLLSAAQGQGGDFDLDPRREVFQEHEEDGHEEQEAPEDRGP